MSNPIVDERTAGRWRRLRVAATTLLFGLLISMVPLAVGTAQPASAAGLTTLYSTMDGPRSVQHIDSHPVGPSALGTHRMALAFTPTASGLAQVLSMRGRCVIPWPSGTTCQGIGTVTIQSDAGGRPSGRVLGSMGFYLTDSLTSGSPVKRECGTISPSPQLTAGTKYWAVMSSPDQIGWDDWTDDPSQMFESVDGAPWEPAFNTKTPALRIDSGSDTCLPVAVPNPNAGTTVGSMITHTGNQAFNTITISNSGVVPLTLGNGSFSGTDASAFSLMDMQPSALAKPFPFPRQVGVDGVSILYVTCTGGATERWYRATLKIETSDPARPTISFPVECLVDNTPPTVQITMGQPDGLAGWWKTSPATLSVSASDPPLQQITNVSCSDTNPGARWSSSSVQGAGMSPSVAGEGVHNIGCSARDLAGNWSGASLATFKIDSMSPEAIGTVSPRANEDGWNNGPVIVQFDCRDPEPGSGVSVPVTGGGGSVAVEMATTTFTSQGCSDVAGYASKPTVVTVKTDWTLPVIAAATVTPAPNGSGWNRTPVTVSFTCADTGAVQSGVKTGPPDVTVSDDTPGWTVTSSGDCTDKAGNKADKAMTKTVKIDKTAPTTQLDSVPAAVTNTSTATFKYSGSDSLSGVSKYECRLDGAAFQTCSSTGKTYADLAAGEHTFDVRAVDTAGNSDGSPETKTWTIDTRAPETSVDSHPDPITSATSALFTYRGDTDVATYECRLDDAAFQSCPNSGVTYSGLAGGEHRVEVRATDAAGNVDASPAAFVWSIDLVAPKSTITSGPPMEARRTDATFVFDAVDTGGSTVAGFECQLDGGPFEKCTSPYTVTGLERVSHTMAVRALDAVGNVESTPVEYSWAILTFVARDDTASTLEDTAVSIDVVSNDVVPAGATITVSPVESTSAHGGTVTADSEGTIRYAPPVDFHGTDTFSYTASNGAAATQTATVSVAVAPVNDVPSFDAGGPITVDEDSPAYSATWATGMSAGPENEAGQNLRFVLSDNTAKDLFSVGPTLTPEGMLTFTPARNASGTATVTVRLVDGGGTGNGGVDMSPPVTFTIGVRSVDDAPTIAVAKALTCAAETAALRLVINDVDHASSALRLSRSVSPTTISVTFAGTGSQRTMTLSRLGPGTRGTLTVRVSDGTRSASTSMAILVGSDGKDTVSGSSRRDVLVGRRGNDTLRAAGGTDLVCGGAGNDRINGGTHSDFCDGGTGTDQATACERRLAIP